MSSKFDTNRVQPPSTEPQLTSFTGLGATEELQGGGSKDECMKILIQLNEETARYCFLASALGTNVDTDSLRRKLKMCRVRAWDHAKNAKNKLIPVIKRKKIQMESCEDLERMYRALSACLEFLEQQYYTTLLLQADFTLQPDSNVSINTGTSISYVSRKCPDYRHNDPDRSYGNPDVQSMRSMRSVRSSDHRSGEREDVHGLQQDMTDIHDLVYSMNQIVAIQSWEVDPDLETDKFTVAVDLNNSSRNSPVPQDSVTEENYNRKLRCVSIVIFIIIIVIIGGIVGILMGVLD